jgi:hypothetical protein
LQMCITVISYYCSLASTLGTPSFWLKAFVERALFVTLCCVVTQSALLDAT